ncbi:hypothetical protein ACTXT7_017595, partial [Hymenolepis weldensis]
MERNLPITFSYSISSLLHNPHRPPSVLTPSTFLPIPLSTPPSTPSSTPPSSPSYSPPSSPSYSPPSSPSYSPPSSPSYSPHSFTLLQSTFVQCSFLQPNSCTSHSLKATVIRQQWEDQ